MASRFVKISAELFSDLCFFHLLADERPELRQRIEKALESKLESMEKHDLYSRSKTAELPGERERARQRYLDKVGMRESFRWPENGDK